MFKVIAILAFVAAANAGGVAYFDHRIDDLGTVGAQSEQTVRGLGFGGLSTVSHQTKAVDSAYSSVRKHDTRVINPAVYAQPAVAYAHAPAVAAPVAYHHQPAVLAARPAVAAYAAPAVAAPAVYSGAAYHHQPAVVAAPAVAAPVAYHGAAVAAPVAYHGAAVAAPVASTTGLLGVRYSSFPQAASYHFDSPVLGHFAY